MTVDKQRLDIVYYLSPDWERFHRPKMVEALARALAPAGGKVLCVNRPICPFTTPLRHPRKWFRWLIQGGGPQELAENLFLFTPCVFLHELIAMRLPGVGRLNRWLLARGIGRAIRKVGLGARERVAWIIHPYQVGYLGLANETVAIYECQDEHSEVEGLSPGRKDLLRELEGKLLRRSDVVFATSSALYERKKPSNPHTYFVPNASDTGLFAQAQDPVTLIAEPMRGLSHPVIGYLGVLNWRLDYSLLLCLARSRPEWTLAMVGPIQGERLGKGAAAFAELKRLPNTVFTGWVPQEEMPAFGKAFDVCVIPYRTDSGFTRYANPNKLYEYVAMGKPVVSTDVPAVREEEGIVRVARSHRDFLKLIEEELRGDCPEKVRERLAWAGRNSWENRVETVLRVISERLSAHAIGEGKARDEARHGDG